MLTIEKLRTYKRFGGDIDGFTRSHGRGDSSGITDADWQEIDELRTALHITFSGKATPEFASQVERRLAEAAPESEAQRELRQLAASVR